MKNPTYTTELELLAEYELIAGVDEVGRGPLAGPVVSAAVILDPERVGSYRSKTKWWRGVRDSKALSPHRRGSLVKFIQEHALDFALGEVTHEEIDFLNIHNASLLSMKRALENLKRSPDCILVDGRFQVPGVAVPQKAVIGGDIKILSIACASILAKVYRDELMKRYAKKFSEYGFERHKGYNTSFHRKRLQRYGACPIHRFSFAPVRQAISQSFNFHS